MTFRPIAWVALAVALGPLAIYGALCFAPDPSLAWRRDALLHREDGYAGSEACATCHPDHHASWHRTFHRTMTQVADERSVLGAFDGRTLAFYGREARLRREGGRFLMDLPGTARSEARTAEVAMTVGSRRYQQYFEERGEPGSKTYRRLPLLWHVEEERWLHVNGIFLHPDDPDWEAHAALWNENCIFCHNTAPRPGLRDVDRVRAAAPRGGEARPTSKVFESRVAELGIACETCHGPGAEHVRLHATPWNRRSQTTSDEPDDTIVSPRRLGPDERLALCGQCHGQRLPEPLEAIWDYLRTGPSFRPGDRLERHVTPVSRETPGPPSRPDLFADRFYGDSTPRLTAYEYQGMKDSPCAVSGPLSCDSCHVMHGGDPHGMIEPRLRGNDACLQCHEDLREGLEEHTHHAVGSSGSACLDCHMPRIVYGILTVHRSHRIENPDAWRDARHGRPNACTLCHLDRSLAWAERETALLWGKELRPIERADSLPADFAEGFSSLLTGDALVRAVQANAFGREGPRLEPGVRALARLPLLITLLDAYPAVRRIAWRSLLALEEHDPLALMLELREFDPMASVEARRMGVERLLERAVTEIGRRHGDSSLSPAFLRPDGTLDREAIHALLQKQDARVISIGE